MGEAKKRGSFEQRKSKPKGPIYKLKQNTQNRSKFDNQRRLVDKLIAIGKLQKISNSIVKVAEKEKDGSQESHS